ncbi:MAG: 4Fe-4S binding protein [Azospirillaceae bacterium]|nr:4Fe-4S binding protein [Azospirillaceae bacterium]
MNFLKILARNLALGPSTDPFPFGETFTPKGLRGRVEFDAENCTACRYCEQVCIGGAIRFSKTPEGMRFLLWHNTCTFCGLCEFYCPTHAIHLTEDWHLAHGNEDKYAMVENGLLPTIVCTQCGAEAIAIAPNPTAFKEPATEGQKEQYRHLCARCRRKFLQGAL